MKGNPAMNDSEYTFDIEHWDNAAARAALAKVAPGQRSPSPDLVRVFRAVYNGGHWHPGIGTPFGFRDDGTMLNGIHRATFIAGLPDGVTVPVLVFRNMPDWALKHYDSGKNRTMGNFVRYAFPETNDAQARTAASIAQLVMTYSGPGSLPTSGRRHRPESVVEWAIKHGERLFTAAIQARQIIGLERGRVGRVMTERTLGFVLYFIPESEAFFRDLATRRYDGEDPRQAMTDYYGIKTNAFAPDSQGAWDTRVRIAELLACWDARRRGVTYPRGKRWRAWDGEEATFRHPPVNHDGECAA